jgi:hypothetical protein
LSLTEGDKPGQFNATLLESIDATITALLSREVADALYRYLYRIHSIPRNEVPSNIEKVSFALQQTFGMPSSRTICKFIAKRFYANLDLDFPNNPTLTLPDYVEEARRTLLGGK